MNDWVDQIEANILSRKLLRAGESLLLAVSGGLDSMVLLRVLCQLASKHGWKLSVAHFNHQLRGRSSDADERLVRKTAGELGLAVAVGRGDVRHFAASKKLSIEMAARQLRHEFFVRVARETKVKKIALAHHADDQIELFFLRLQRGSGSEGLSGMDWSAPSPFHPRVRLIRPLLNESREKLEVFARQNKVPYREDASNASVKHLRNRIRQELIPVLKRQSPPIFETALRSMEIIGAEGEFVAEAAGKWREDRKLAFNDLHLALQRRILHDELREMNVPVDFELIERLRGAPGQLFSIARDLSIFRDENGRVHRVQPQIPEFCADSASLEVKEKGQCVFGGLCFQWIVRPHTGVVLRKARTEFFDADKIGRTILLRHWQAGDRFQPIGMQHEVKLQDWFVNLKVPAAERRQKVVAVAENGEIFWVEGSRISDGFKLSRDTGRKLKWSWKST